VIVNEWFFSYCFEKLNEKQKELDELNEEKEFSPMKEALKERGIIKEEDEQKSIIEDLQGACLLASKCLNCSYLDAWNADYIDLYEGLIFWIRNGGDN
jgi:hypothetical protein